MKKTMKNRIFLILMMMLVISSAYINYSTYAGEEGSGGIDFTQADEFLSQGSSSTSGIKGDDLNDMGGQFSSIGQILTYIGAGVMIGAMGYMGILFLISPPEKQAKLKQQLVGLVVAGVVIFGAYAIWSILVNMLTGIVG